MRIMPTTDGEKADYYRTQLDLARREIQRLNRELEDLHRYYVERDDAPMANRIAKILVAK